MPLEVRYHAPKLRILLRALSLASTVIAAAFGATPAAAQTDEPPAPFVAPSGSSQRFLAVELEREFQSFFQRCSRLSGPITLTRRRAWGNETRRITSIDLDVVRELGLQTGRPEIFRGRSDISLGGVFGYVYTEAETTNIRNNGTAAAWDQNRFLRIPRADENIIVQPMFTTVSYSASCGSIIQGALTASSEYQLPIGTISAALNADYEGERIASLQLHSGRFLSPIYEMWTDQVADGSQSRPANAFYVGVIFWDFYRNRPVQRYYLATRVTGVSLHTASSARAGREFSASAGSRMNVPLVFESTSTGNVTDNVQSGLEVSQPRIFIEARPGVADGVGIYFERLPEPRQAADLARSNFSPSVSYPEGQVVRAGQSRLFNIAIPALPTAFCDEANWHIRQVASSQTALSDIRLLSAEPIDNNRTCQMHFRFDASSDASGEINRSILLRSREAAGDVHLELPIYDVSFSTLQGPTLAFRRDEGLTIQPEDANGQTYRLTWRLWFDLLDGQSFSDAELDVSRVTVRCPPGVVPSGRPDFRAVTIGSPGASSRTLEFTGVAQYRGQLGTAPYARTTCSLEGEVQFREGSRVVARRSINPAVELQHPAGSPQMAPAF